ncbi:hypothetical protein HHI36_009484 [Cryptolaemus montrouzieri]|uniref:N-acetyllactosaminide beta-1,3-N-acetylglucosaminyltransferase n=1 Tax=Cryptolaemus montrouzieri TaxID=559131 RepID=A0ABD2MG10_9CUCU
MPSYKRDKDIRQVLVVLTVVFFLVTLIFLNYVLFSTRAFIFEQSIKTQLPPIPGSFLRNFLISNESYCNFNYGLPTKLNYTDNDLQYPPQEGINSSYRILYNAVRAEYEDVMPNITYVTHVTVDFTLFIPEIVRYWNGPTSIAVFIPAKDAQLFFHKLSQVCFCLPDMSKVSIHIVFPVGSEPYIDENSNTTFRFQDCNVENILPEQVNRVKNNIFYPINVGRNIARQAAKTQYVMVTDIELIPSKNLAKNFMQLMKVLRRTGQPQVYVVPIFEVDCGYDMPLEKKDLLNLVRMGVAVYFHRFVCPHCQKFPGIDNWLENNNGNGIRPFLSVKREYPFHRWEPVFIGTKLDPLYDEALSWEGLQDKMTQVLEMCLLNYSFIILDGAFLVHWPGIKKKQQKGGDAWRIPYMKKNSERYGRIIDRLSQTAEYTKSKRCKLK